MLRLYDNLSSGNGYKVRLMLTQLGIQFQRIDLDTFAGETRTPEFLAKNPNGKIPALELEDGTVLAESNAILFYLAERTPFLPEDRLERARCCSGCSSNSTATSPMWPYRGPGSCTRPPAG